MRATYTGPAVAASILRAFAPWSVLPLMGLLLGATPAWSKPSQVATVLTLRTSANPVAVGQPVTLLAKITPANATGVVTFLDGGTVLGSATLAEGAASFTTRFGKAGKYHLTAQYEGADRLKPAKSKAIQQVVTDLPVVATSVGLSLSANPVAVGQTVLLTATVSPADAAGVVTFLRESTQLGSVPVGAGGIATLSTSYGATGVHILSAEFVPSAGFKPSRSPSAIQTVEAPPQLQPPVLSPVPVVQYEYDALGNMTRRVQAPGVPGLGLATVDGYDRLSRLTSRTDARNGSVRIGHDGLDRPTSVTDPRNLTTTYARTGLGDTTALASPDTGTAQMSYDAAGNLASRTDSRGVLATYSHDPLDRLTQVVYTRAGEPSQVITWTYDQTGPGFSHGIGRLTSTSHAAGSSQYSHDAQGRVLTATQRIAATPGANSSDFIRSVTYGYDAAGNPTSITYPSGRMVSIGYAQGKPVSIALARDVGSPAVPLLGNIEFTPFGGAVAGWRWQYANGERDNRRLFDTSGRPVRYQLANLLRDISYDAADRITGYTHRDARSGAATAEAVAQDQGFGYDELGRITRISRATANWSIAYDATGNRTSVVSNGSARTYTVDSASNRLLGVDNPPLGYAYDAAGNVTGLNTATAVYDLSGRWASANNGGSATHFSYDAFGQRIRKFSNTGAHTTVLFMYDQNGQLIGEYDATGAPIREYVWLGTTPVAVFTAPPGGNNSSFPEVFFIHTDHIDTPRVVTDRNNVVRWRWMAEPFGTDAAEEDPSGAGKVTLPLRFPGQYADTETGLYYNYFRDYDPWAGRYVQSDPIGLAGGINTYSYVVGNPVSLTDSRGLQHDIRPSRPNWPSWAHPTQPNYSCATAECAAGLSRTLSDNRSTAEVGTGQCKLVCQIALWGPVAICNVAIGGGLLGTVAGGVAKQGICSVVCR